MASVLFDADTGRFVANVGNAEQAVTKQAEAVARAKNSIVEWGQQAIASAQEQGKSYESLAAIQQRTAQRLASVTESNASRITAATERQISQIRQVANELKTLDNVISISEAKSAIEGVSKRQQASAILRAGSGSMSIRAAESFATMLPGFSQIASVAFPVVGALALGDAVVHLVEGVEKFYADLQKLPQAITDGFGEMHLSAQTANDELAVTNDRLESQIAHLEHKPATNGIQTALDEAKVSADHLLTSLTADGNKIDELLSKHSVGIMGALFDGKAVTSPFSDQVKKYNDAITGAQNDRVIALNNGDSQAAEAAQNNVYYQRKQAEKWAQYQLDVLNRNKIVNGADDTSNDANVAILKGSLSMWDVQDDAVTQQNRNNTDAVKLKGLQDAKTVSEQSQKAAEAQVKAWQQQLDVAKSGGDETVYAEGEYWALLAGTVKKGSYAYNEAMEKANEASARLHKEYNDTITKWNETQDKTSLGIDDDHDESLRHDFEPAGRESIANTAKWIDSQNAGIAIGQKNADSLATANIQYDEATHKITELTAAQLTAVQHANEYAEAMDRLSQALAYYQSQVTSTSAAEMERRKNVSDTQNAIATLTGSRAVQTVQDQQSIYSANQNDTVSGALDKMVDSWGTMTQQIASTLTSTINSFNGGIADALTTKTYNSWEYKRNFERALGSSVHQAGSSLIRNGLQTGESVFSKIPGLGGITSLLGKPAQKVSISNTAANPIWVKSVDALLGSSGGGINLTSLTGGGGGGDSTLGGLETLASIGIPFLAGGGDVSRNSPVVVGDGGKPELFVPHTSGRVYPDANAFSGGDTHNVYIDATGATDPDAVTMQVHRAMQQYLPVAINGSLQAMQDMKARRPASKAS